MHNTKSFNYKLQLFLGIILLSANILPMQRNNPPTKSSNVAIIEIFKYWWRSDPYLRIWDLCSTKTLLTLTTQSSTLCTDIKNDIVIVEHSGQGSLSINGIEARHVHIYHSGQGSITLKNLRSETLYVMAKGQGKINLQGEYENSFHINNQEHQGSLNLDQLKKRSHQMIRNST